MSDALPLPAGPPALPLGGAGTVARVFGADDLTSQVWARCLLCELPRACTVALAGSLVCILDSKPWKKHTVTFQLITVSPGADSLAGM